MSVPKKQQQKQAPATPVGNKGKTPAAPKPKAPESVRLPLGVVEAILKLDVPVPTNVADVEATVTALQTLRASYEKRQADEMRKGEEEERLEREAETAAAAAAAAAPVANGHAAADAADEPSAEEKDEGEI